LSSFETDQQVPRVYENRGSAPSRASSQRRHRSAWVDDDCQLTWGGCSRQVSCCDSSRDSPCNTSCDIARHVHRNRPLDVPLKGAVANRIPAALSTGPGLSHETFGFWRTRIVGTCIECRFSRLNASAIIADLHRLRPVSRRHHRGFVSRNASIPYKGIRHAHLFEQAIRRQPPLELVVPNRTDTDSPTLTTPGCYGRYGRAHDRTSW
jgi:hypothetical protein